MNVVYSSSDAYCECTSISMISLFENNKNVDELVVYVLSTDISKQNKDYILAIAKEYGREVNIIDAKDDFINNAKRFNLELSRGAYNTYSRIMLNTWFNNLDKIIVIDSDTLVVDEITEMWNIDLDGKLIAAVPEIGVYSKNNTIESKEILDSIPMYFNMGMVVVNLKEWRKLKIDEYLSSILDGNEEIFKVVDQSIINKYLNNYIVRMNLRYNFYSPMHGTSVKTIKKVFCKKDVFDEKEIIEAQRHPAIIHFYGQSYERPWFKHNASIYRKLYSQYRNMSKWKNEKKSKWKKASNFVLKTYDVLCFLLLKFHMNNCCLYFKFVLGQKIKGKTNIKR